MKLHNCLVLIILIFFNAYGFSKEESPKILSDFFESSGDFIIYRKNVELITDKYKIFADFIKYNVKTKDIVASGRVTMTSEDMTVSGGELDFNIKRMEGEMYDVVGLMEPSVKFFAEKIEQTGKDVQKFRKMKFTSCTQNVPRWIISCSKGKIKKDKYIDMKNAVLKIKNIPVLYIPYLRYPIKDGKSTGFLFPVVGNSDRFGFFTKNSFFWNIKPNLDLTFSYDYISKIGNGAETELRYLFRNSEGSIKLYMFDYSQSYKDSLGEGEEIDDKDYNINIRHLQRSAFLNTTIRADINYQSNPEFQSVFNKDYGRYNRSRFNSSVSLTSHFSNLSLSVIVSRNETFYIQKNSSNIITKMPSLTLNLKQQRLWRLPGFFSFRGMFESISRSGIDYEDEADFTSDVTSDRFSFIPHYTLNLFKLPWLSATVELLSKNSYYFKSQDPETKEVINEPLHLSYNTAKLTMKGPSFYKIYENKVNKIKHVIEPEIRISYSTKVDDAEREKLIPVDLFDYPSYSFVSFSLNSRFYVKSKKDGKSIREVFTYTLSQKFYFDPEIANRYRTISVGEENIYPEFSELINTFKVRPTKDISVDLTLAYNHYLEKFQKINFSVGYLDKSSPVYGKITYSLYENPFKAKDYFLNTELVRGNLNVQFPRFPVNFNGAIDYDIGLKRFRYGSIIASYDYQCINFNAEMKIYTLFDGSTDFQYTVGVTFGNLGMVKDFFGGAK